MHSFLFYLNLYILLIVLIEKQKINIDNIYFLRYNKTRKSKKCVGVKIVKLKKKSENFKVFSDYKFTRDYFIKNYGLKLNDMNDYFIKNSRKANKIDELHCINEHLLQYATKRTSERFGISEKDREFIVHNLLNGKRGEINKNRLDFEKFCDKALNEFVMYCNQYLRCEDFLKSCVKINRVEEKGMDL